MQKITDPKLLAQLNAPDTNDGRVTDPAILAQLNGEDDQRSGLVKLADTVADPINAAGAGVRKGVTDVAGDIGGFVNELIAKVSPKAAKGLSKAYAPVMEQLGAPLPQEEKAVQDYPMLNSIGAGVGNTAATFGLTGAAGALKNGAANVAAQVGLGSALAGPGNRIEGGILGGFVPAVSKIAGSVGKFLSSNASQADEVLGGINKVNTSPSGQDIYKATDEAFKSFRAVPGKVSTVRPAAAIKNYVKQYSQVLNPKQTQILQEFYDGVSKASNLDDLHAARKAFTTELGKSFLKGNDALGGKSREGIMALKNTVENSLKANASKFGALPKYEEANKLFKQTMEADILNDALRVSKDTLDGNKWLNFSNKILKLKEQDAKLFSPDTKKMLTGIQKTLIEANTILGMKATIPGIGIIKTMTQTPGMRDVLIKAGSQGGRAIAKTTAETIAQILQSQTLKAINPQDVEEME